ncbi:hypothetical protein DQ239_10895 [Blastococcus sp. TF02-09]|nr:hypothetical protein DQ239_10895 [Blastococcus sp. TF02-9]
MSVVEKVGWFRRELVPRAVTYLDWTIDGVPLREVVAWPDGSVASEVTPVRNDAALPDYEADYLRAILGEPVSREWTVMPDGRVPLLVCHVDFDLDCRALTAELVRGDDRVEWRSIGWQAAYAPLDLTEQEMPVTSLVFDRQQYDDVVRPLLAAAPEG